jgi:hypothetical protein
MKKLHEKVLGDDYPVFYGHYYVCDGEVISSDIEGNVGDLKYDLKTNYGMKAEVITTCDCVGRGLL